MKRCSSCNETKADDEFSRNRHRPDGRQDRCRPCHRAAVAAAYRKNPGRRATYHAAWYEQNAEAVRARVADYRKANPDASRKSKHKKQALKSSARLLGRVDYAEIRRRDRGMCWLCDALIESAADLHFDHAIPLSRGGEHSTRNIRMAHRGCNERKHTRAVTHQMYLL